MNENQELQKLFEGVVPERLDEVLDLVETHSAKFRRIGDKVGFNLDAGAFGAIQFTQRSLEQLWLFGFSGLYALHCYSAVAVLAKCYGLKFDLDEIDGLPDQKEENERFSKIIEIIGELSGVASEHDFTWPQGIPKPENGKPKNIEQAAVFDLILMATAYVFLHELKHVIFESEGNAPSNPLEEEMKCDTFASEMMLSQIDKYSILSGYPEDKVRMKRSMGIALGNAFLAVATPKDKIAGTDTHPPVYERWSATLGGITLEENDFYWLYFASLAIALLKYKEINFPSVPVTSYRQLAISAIDALESSI
ncbi:phage exclusion protein Lit family protein [Nitrosomonas sp. Is37]|uniref:phage exclusion protein Lit family protein n=1 Tax=Nitrosomonas sp. Is37 TaxID=3080535 RepID=UPI00294B58FD|nr:phage exclusion protein Lit family protein [Nitrosomonas sp. Is37]MDV6344065.1 phage exclusion protein Lit family protein [Nitrosomonas sp. Is37]